MLIGTVKPFSVSVQWPRVQISAARKQEQKPMHLVLKSFLVMLFFFFVCLGFFLI